MKHYKQKKIDGITWTFKKIAQIKARTSYNDIWLSDGVVALPYEYLYGELHLCGTMNAECFVVNFVDERPSIAIDK